MSYCPDCSNILDISKSDVIKVEQDGGAKKKQEVEKKDEVEEDEVVEDKVENKEEEEEEDESVKSKSKQKNSKVASNTTNLGANNPAYYLCNNCGFSKLIEPGAKIFTR